MKNSLLLLILFGFTIIGRTMAQAANEIIVLNETENNNTVGFEWLGYGYKGNELYAALESITDYPIYDMNQVEVEISYRDLKPSELTSYSEKSIAKYNHSRFSKLEVGRDHSLFSATPVINFNGFKESTNVNSLITGIRVIRAYRLTVPKNAPLNTTFSNDLESMNPFDLYEKYGTHVLNSFIVGARYEASSYLESSGKNEKNVKIALKAVIDKILGASGQIDGLSIENEDLIVERLNIWSYGGEGEEDYNLWLDNINDNNLAIAEFENNSLIPLYELIKNNKSRKAELKRSHDEYLNEYGIRLWSSKLNIIPNNEDNQISEEYNQNIDDVLETLVDIGDVLLTVNDSDPTNKQENRKNPVKISKITNILGAINNISDEINNDTENESGITSDKIEKINNIIGSAIDIENELVYDSSNGTKEVIGTVGQISNVLGGVLKIYNRNKKRKQKKEQRISAIKNRETNNGKTEQKINKINYRTARKESNSVDKIERKIEKIQEKWD